MFFFSGLLESAIKDFIPVVTVKRKFPPWFDRELRSVLREKEAAYKGMKMIGCDREFRDRRRVFKNLSDKKYNEYLIGLTEELITNPKRFWTFLSQ